VTLSPRASLDADGRPLPQRPAIATRRVRADLILLTDSTVKTYFPDFSHWSGEIDWSTAARYFMASIFKASESDWFVDSQFAANKAGSIARGRGWGAYHFYRDNVDPVAQAAHFVNTVGGGCNLYVLDVEISHNHDSAKVLACLNEIQRLTGKTPVIYSSKYYWAFLRPVPTWIGNYGFWTAHYGTLTPLAPTGAHIEAHQYGVTGTIPGVPELGCDENFFYGSAGEMWEWFMGDATPPPEEYHVYLPIVSREG